MSTFKKVISIVLCLTMVLGTFAIAGDLFIPKASAAVGESRVKTYAELEAEHEDFMYVAVDVMEYDADGNPYYTDHYVEAGDTLQLQYYIKSTRRIGNADIYLQFDSAFFDLTEDGTSYYSGETLTANPAHELSETDVAANPNARGLLVSYTTKDIHYSTKLGKLGFTDDEIAAMDTALIAMEPDIEVAELAMKVEDDDYLVAQDVKVKEGLADETKGRIYSDERIWCLPDNDGIANAFAEITNSYLDVTSDDTTLDDLDSLECTELAHIIIDVEHTFTIGANPDEGGSTGGETGPVVGESRVKTYAELVAEYEDFMYVAVDVMEYAEDGSTSYTDHYVNAGDTLQLQYYIKSTRRIGNADIYLQFDSDFFDLTEDGTSYYSGETLTANPAHELSETDVDANPNARGLLVSYTTKDIHYSTKLGKLGFTDDEIAAMDTALIAMEPDIEVAELAMKVEDDDYLVAQDVKVKEGLADETKGRIYSDERIWCLPDNAGIANAFAEITNSYLDVTSDDTTLDDLDSLECTELAHIIIDVEHEFTIGANPAESGAATKPSVIFVENDGTQISKTPYDEGATVVIPAAVDNQVGWANVATGEVTADLTGLTMGRKSVTYKRVLSTDEFSITLDINGGAIDTENLPEGVTANEDGTLEIKAAIGEKVSLADVQPTMEGYTGKWNPEEITLNNINGVKVTIEWTPNTYSVKFYAEKGDETTATTVNVVYGESIEAPEVTKEGYNFVNWKSVEDDSIFDVDEAYTLTEDSAYYAEWSPCDSSFTFMVMDYSTGEWKTLKSFYGNKGETLAKNNLDSIRSGLKAEDIGWDGNFRTETAFAFSTAIGSGYFASKALTYDGNQTIYVNTKISIDVEWNIPVYDEAADAYGETVKTVTATIEMALNGTSSVAAIASSEYTPATGYTLAAWNNADGETVSNYATSNNGLNFTIKAADGAAQKYTAVYADAEYVVKFAIGDTFSTEYTLKNNVSKGDIIDLATVEVVDSKGNAAALPVIGEVSNQYDGKQGNKLVGWRILGTATEFPVEITKEFIETNYNGTAIVFNATWEPQTYDATFKYEKADGTVASFVVSGIAVGTPFSQFAPNAETIALINENAPEGKVFVYWDNEGRMTSGGREFNAVFENIRYNVYIDYGFEKAEGDPMFNEIWQKEVAYGDDARGEGGIITLIGSISWSGERTPPAKALPTGWEIYHLAENSDINDDTTWKSGINGDGTDVVKSDLVFRASWRTYDQFLFRVMDTAGQEYCALGKNFKMYYFANNKSCTRQMATLNPNDSTIVLLFKPVFENGSLRLDPISFPKSMFTVAGMTGIFRALVDAIGGLIKG